MKKAFCPTVALSSLPFLLFLLFSVQADAQDKGTYTDKRDGHTYSWVRTGKLTWMNENLRFATPSGSWIANNDSANPDTYGRLYDWTTAMTACPKGWHLPSDAEWDQLIKSLGGEEVAGEKYQAMDTIGRDPSKTAIDPGFCSLFAGTRHNDGAFSGAGKWGGFWSSTEADADNANNILFAHGSTGISKSSNSKTTGFSIRCVRKK